MALWIKELENIKTLLPILDSFISGSFYPRSFDDTYLNALSNGNTDCYVFPRSIPGSWRRSATCVMHHFGLMFLRKIQIFDS